MIPHPLKADAAGRAGSGFPPELPGHAGPRTLWMARRQGNCLTPLGGPPTMPCHLQNCWDLGTVGWLRALVGQISRALIAGIGGAGAEQGQKGVQSLPVPRDRADGPEASAVRPPSEKPSRPFRGQLSGWGGQGLPSAELEGARVGIRPPPQPGGPVQGVHPCKSWAVAEQDVAGVLASPRRSGGLSLPPPSA